MKNKTLLFSTVLAATGIGVLAGNSEAKADTVYTVQSGDTLFKISRDFTGGNGFVDEIIKANNIQNPNLIYVGQQLTIPTYGEATEATTQQQTVEQSAPVQAPAVQETQQQETQQQETQQQSEQTSTQSAQNTQNTQEETAYTPSSDSSEEAAKAWIANKESGGSYSARNGRYIGKYQLDASYLNGDYSAANQERVANNYVQSRYGSWANAKAFWESNGWY